MQLLRLDRRLPAHILELPIELRKERTNDLKSKNAALIYFYRLVGKSPEPLEIANQRLQEFFQFSNLTEIKGRYTYFGTMPLIRYAGETIVCF